MARLTSGQRRVQERGRGGIIVVIADQWRRLRTPVPLFDIVKPNVSNEDNDNDNNDNNKGAVWGRGDERLGC